MELCDQYHVKHLALFGSGVSEASQPRDLDFIVEFHVMPPVEHAECYLRLLKGLEQLFAMKIDLIEPGPIRNPYFLESLKKTQVDLYNAA